MKREEKAGLLEVGGMFGDYSVVRLLGKGSMGEVYLLRDKEGKQYAAKIMCPPGESGNDAWVTRFTREARFAMTVQHKNLVAVHKVGKDEATGVCYIIMDYVPGGTLSERLKKDGKLGIHEAVDITVQIASVLEVAHSVGVVHRDIKPDNILFDSDGSVKLSDLGVAKFRDTGTVMVTATEMIIGTPAYMAPEQMMDSHNVDARADIYSLGLVLYEMLSGTRPHANSTVVELLTKAIKNEELPDIRTLRPEVSIALSQVISMMVAAKPEERIATAMDVVKMLYDARSDRLVLQKGSGFAGKSRAGCRSRWLWGIVAAGLTACAVAAWLVFPHNPEERLAKELASAIQIEAKVQGSKVAHISDDHGFKLKKEEAVDLLARANAFYDAEKWPVAAAAYSNYVAKCEALIAFDAQRQDAVRRMGKAQSAFHAAESCGARTLDVANWHKAETLLHEASSRFDGMEFSEASVLFDKAIYLLKDATERAIGERRIAEEERVAKEEAEAERRRAAERKLVEEAARLEEARLAAEQEKQRQDRMTTPPSAMKTGPVEGTSSRRVTCPACRGQKTTKTYSNCVACHGTGQVTQSVTCSACSGRGYTSQNVQCDACRGTGRTNIVVPCQSCRGGGKVLNSQPCPKCNGEGVIWLPGSRTTEGGNARASYINHQRLGTTKTLTLPGGVTMEMIYVAPGSFMMGSPESEDGHGRDETQHRVTLTKGFWLGKYEVTQKQWRSVMGNNPSKFTGDDRPVENVSWEDCQKFIAKVDAIARRQFGGVARLPSEAEWEYACRAGTTTAYSWGNALNGDKANCNGNYPYGTTVNGRYTEATSPVGSYLANNWGFHDMHGNVYEWCLDWYDKDYYSKSPGMDPCNTASGDCRVLRGGCWNGDARNCRSANRDRITPGYRNFSYGFRLCCSAGEVAPPKPAVDEFKPYTGPTREYVVKAGDTFLKIARDNGITLRQLRQLNDGLDSYVIRVGQKLKVPAEKVIPDAAPDSSTTSSPEGETTYKVTEP